MANTAKLGLPLIDDNMVADVPRDVNAVANGVDAKVGVANGLATLGADGKVPAGQLSVTQPPDASTTTKGIVKLNDATNSTSVTEAATANAVKKAYDEALAGKQLGVEQKANVVAALNSIGVPATTSETWAQLIPKIAAVIRATGNVTAADVLAGKTATNESGPITGTMPNRGAGGTVTPGTTNQTKAAGYYSSAITINGDSDLISSNIRKNVNIFNIAGSLEEGTPYHETNLGNIAPSGTLSFNTPFQPRIVTVTAANSSASTVAYISVLVAKSYTSSGGIDIVTVFDGGFISFKKGDGTFISNSDYVNGKIAETSFRVSNGGSAAWYNLSVRAWG